MPEIEWDNHKLKSHIKDMESVEFWQQKGIICCAEGKIDAAIDYFRQGLKKNPTESILIYSLANCYA
jgi:tetratricopeptide (TPR) repeat protein